MKITYIQTYLHWENREKNLQHFDSLIDNIRESTDLIILPEMFTTGFTMNPKQFAENDNLTLEWLKQKARQRRAVITGSVAVCDNNKFYNRLYWVQPSEKYSSYDKRHLFTMGKENEHYTAGTQKLIAQVKDWNACPLICYDLRFPIWSRNKMKITSCSNEMMSSAFDPALASLGADYDLLIYVANWPEVRSYPWKQLLIARAIENQCYVIGVNRVGLDVNKINHSGDSLIINPRGEVINNPKANEESIETVTLDKNYLNDFRKAFPVGLDADDFKII